VPGDGSFAVSAIHADEHGGPLYGSGIVAIEGGGER
jgi:hypothetical protein